MPSPTLRRRKHRADKPFAVMVRDLAAAESLAEIDDARGDAADQPAAADRAAARRRDAVRAHAAVAPGNPLVGVMLPYTPVHHLLFDACPVADAPVPTCS